MFSIKKLTKSAEGTLTRLAEPKSIDDAVIPSKILRGAKGIAFITIAKAGFVFSGSAGAGIVIAKLPNGSWSGPTSVGVGGMGWGAQIGASLTESVIILNTSAAVKAFSGKGQIKFGGNLSLAAGPVGRDAEASVNAGDGGVAACYSYSHTKGLFAGVSLQGVILFEREKDNKTFYGVKVSSKDILQGSVTAPHSRDLDKLYAALGKYCGNKPLSKRVSKKMSTPTGRPRPLQIFRTQIPLSRLRPRILDQLRTRRHRLVVPETISPKAGKQCTLLMVRLTIGTRAPTRQRGKSQRLEERVPHLPHQGQARKHSAIC